MNKAQFGGGSVDGKSSTVIYPSPQTLAWVREFELGATEAGGSAKA